MRVTVYVTLRRQPTTPFCGNQLMVHLGEEHPTYELRHHTQKRYWARQHTRDRDCYVVQRDLEWSGPLLQSFNWEEVLWGGNAEFSSMIIEPLKGRFAVRSECCNSFKFLGLQLNQIGTLIYNIVMTDGSGSLYQRVGGR